MSNEEIVKVKPINNGNEFETYTWTQNHKDVQFSIKLPLSTKTKEIDITFGIKSLKIKVRDEIIIDGNLFSFVKVENCFWMIDDNMLIVELDKKKFDEWWEYAIEGEPHIDLGKIITPKGSLDDLDQETRMTIDKMLYEQKIKEESGLYKNINT